MSRPSVLSFFQVDQSQPNIHNLLQMRTLLLVCSIVGWLAACVVSSNETLITTFIIYNPQYTYFPSIFEEHNINDCVRDTLSLDGVLLNASFTYDQKVRLFTSKRSYACPFLKGNPFSSFLQCPRSASISHFRTADHRCGLTKRLGNLRSNAVWRAM